MKFIKFQHTYNHDWETVTSAFWVKYPNPLQPHVNRVDTLSYDIDSENMTLHTWRLMSLNYNVPKWIGRLISASGEGFGLEEIECNLNSKTLVLKSQNLTFQNIFLIEEVCEYSVHPENPDWTLYTQQARFTVPSLGIAGSTLEKIAAQSALDKAQKGLKAMARKIGHLEDFKIRMQYDKLKYIAKEQLESHLSILDTYFHSSYKFLNQELSDSIAYYHKMKRELNYWGMCIQKMANDASISASENYEHALNLYTDSQVQLTSCFDKISLKTQKVLSYFDLCNAEHHLSFEPNFLNSFQKSCFFSTFKRFLTKNHKEVMNDADKTSLSYTTIPISISPANSTQLYSSIYKNNSQKHTQLTSFNLNIQHPFRFTNFFSYFMIPSHYYKPTHFQEPCTTQHKNILNSLNLISSSTLPTYPNTSNDSILLSSIGPTNMEEITH